MSLDTILDSMVAGLKAALPELKTVEQVGGKFSFADLRIRSRTLPGGFLACMGTRDGQVMGNKLSTRGLFVLVLAVKSEAGAQNDKVKAMNRLVSKALWKIAFAKNWGDDEVESKPQVVTSLNPYTIAAHEENVSLWGITWEQNISLGDPGIVVLDDFLLASTDYQVIDTGPPIDAHDNLVPE